MTFQVYYRKWRPQRFRELVGQDHVSSTLRQAAQQGRVAHSYLFCGPRGTGKTSTARVLAKAVNCPNREDGDPCNACARCEALNESRFMDLIELDAASNRGIDEIRNIRDRVNLAPVEAGYKVYIIDEAHMLTEYASNAFLKTLEEPPAHAIFILCTTEPHKILPTIISRCQRFDFRRLTSDSIVERLRGICLEEGVDADAEALMALAHSSGGSLRDAENLLEQLVVSYGNQIGQVQVYELLGLGHDERALELIQYLLIGNASAALTTINRAAWDGADLRQLHRQAVHLLRGVLMLKCGARDSLDLPQETASELEDLAPKTSTARVMKSLKLLAEVNMRYDASSSLPLELAVVEACMEQTPEDAPPRPAPPPKPSSAPHPTTERTAVAAPINPRGRANSTTGQLSPGEKGSGDERARVAEPRALGAPINPQGQANSTTGQPSPGEKGSGDERASVAEPRAADVPQVRSPSSPRQVPTGGDLDPVPPMNSEPETTDGSFQDQWGMLVKNLSRYKGKRFNLGALLRDCKGQRVEGDTLILIFAHRSHLERMQEELDDPQGMKTVGEAILASLGASYQLKLTLMGDNGGGSGPSSTIQSPLVRAALSMGARIVEGREQ